MLVKKETVSVERRKLRGEGTGWRKGKGVTEDHICTGKIALWGQDIGGGKEGSDSVRGEQFQGLEGIDNSKVTAEFEYSTVHSLCVNSSGIHS